MRLKILQQDLVGPLQSVSRSIGVKATLPVLGNILFDGEGSNELNSHQVWFKYELKIHIIDPDSCSTFFVRMTTLVHLYLFVISLN